MSAAGIGEVLKALDAPLVAVVLGYVLRWALKQNEQKDELIAKIATRFANTLEDLQKRQG